MIVNLFKPVDNGTSPVITIRCKKGNLNGVADIHEPSCIDRDPVSEIKMNYRRLFLDAYDLTL